MTASTKIRNENSDIDRNVVGQDGVERNVVGERIRLLLDGRGISWLSRETGVAENTLRDALKRGPSKTEIAFKIARALGITLDQLLTGVRSAPAGSALVEVDEADWIRVPRFDLSRLNDEGKGSPIEETPFRKDWLKATVGFASEIWLASMLTEYKAAGIAEGDLVFCREVEPVELRDRQLCLFRVNGRLTIARFSEHSPAVSRAGDNLGEVYINASYIGTDDDQYVPVARILAKFLQRF